MNKFLNLIFNNLRNIIKIEKKQNPTNLIQSNLIDKYIDCNFFDSINTHIALGYKLTKEQEKRYNEEILKALETQNYPSYMEIVELGYHFPDELLISYYFSLANKKVTSDSNKEFAFLEERFIQKTKEISFQKLILSKMNELNPGNEYLDNLTNINSSPIEDFAREINNNCESFIHILPFCNEAANSDFLLNFINFLTKAKKRIEERNYRYNVSTDSLFIEIQNMHNLTQKIKKIADQSINKNITENIVFHYKKNIKLNSINYNLLQSIENNLNLCKENIHFLSMEEQASLKLLTEKHFPELMERYLSFSADDRLVIKDHNNRNSEQLLQKSLENIDFILKQNIDIINEQKISSLSIKSQHLQSIKNNY